jgi:hypothetical protein
LLLEALGKKGHTGAGTCNRHVLEETVSGSHEKDY